MRVKIGNYRGYFGPYQLAEKLLFWMDDDDDRVFKFGSWLAHLNYAGVDELTKEDEKTDTWLACFLYWMNRKNKRKVSVHIDTWDTHSMDHTLALIILPMLKQLKEKSHGAPNVDNDDVPDHLRPSESDIEKFNYDGTTDENYFKRWNYVLDEMIFAFEHIIDDSWEEEYRSGELDIDWVKKEETMYNPITQKNEEVYEMVTGPKDTYKVDWDSIKKVENRIQNGLNLFGKYYRALWD